MDDLIRLVEVRNNGTITDAEFATIKARIRAGRSATLFASVEDRGSYAEPRRLTPLGRGYRGTSRSPLSIA